MQQTVAVTGWPREAGERTGSLDAATEWVAGVSVGKSTCGVAGVAGIVCGGGMGIDVTY